jgi:hypothetical protein
MNLKLLKHTLKLRDNPTFSSVKKIVEIVRDYERRYGEIFLYAKRGKRVEILDEKLFFEFLSESVGVDIDSFEKIEKILSSNSREQNIINTGDSKSTIVSPFAKTILLRKKGELAKLYKKEDLSNLKVDKIVAVENSESFLEIDKLWDEFEEDYFLYLSGNPNTLIREFIVDKEVVFFIDLDIVSLNFYEDIDTIAKRLFVPADFEMLLKSYGNSSLYQKQRRFLRDSYTSELQKVIKSIKLNAKVLEQEVIK